MMSRRSLVSEAARSRHLAIVSLLVLCFLLASAAVAQPVHIPDANLKLAIQMNLGIDHDPTAEEMLALTTFEADGRGIMDLTGIEYAGDLKELSARDNDIEDLGPLGGLITLNSVILSGNHISDLAPLSGLTDLGYVDLSENQISDISPLSEFDNLAFLDVSENPLNAEAYAVFIPQILANNPGIELYPFEGFETLTISSTAGGSVVAPGEGTFAYATGQVVVIEAAPVDSTYLFAGWIGSAVDQGLVADPSALQTTVTVDGSYTLTASFEALPDPWVTVYSNGFEDGVGSEWSRTKTEVTPIGARRFLGQFGNDVVTLRLTGLPGHTQVSLSFDVYAIQSLDGSQIIDPLSSATIGPDPWQVALEGGPVLLRTTFSNLYWDPYYYPQAYPGWYPEASYPACTGAVEQNTLGYTFSTGEAVYPADSVYRLNFTFDHTAASCAIVFSASGLQGIGDEGWGLDNVQVDIYDPSGQAALPFAAQSPSPADGAEGVTPSILSWSPGQTAVYHDVYFSARPTLGARAFAGRFSEPQCPIPSALIPGATYYWRVDEVEADGTTVYPGEVWSFTVSQPSVPQQTLTVSSVTIPLDPLQVDNRGAVLSPGEGAFEVDKGTVVALDAAPLQWFVGWSGTAVDQGKVADPNAAQTTVVVDGDYSLIATFEERALIGVSLGESTGEDFEDRTSTNNTAETTFVEQVTGQEPDPNGMVRMETLEGQTARVKVRFAPCTASRLSVQFDYLFERSGLELAVYLSDVEALLAHDDPQRAAHYREIGRIRSPDASSAGAPGSAYFAKFREEAWTTGLDLSSGTWVELELGTAGMSSLIAAASGDSAVLWDNLEADVYCWGACLNVTWEGEGLTWEDVAMVMSWFGATSELDDAGLGGRCLEGLFSDDGYIDTFDLHAWLWAYSDKLRAGDGPWSSCRKPLPLDGRSRTSTSSVSAAGMLAWADEQTEASDQWPQQLLVLGKPAWSRWNPQIESYHLALFDPDLTAPVDYETADLPSSCDIRVVGDPNGHVYLVNSEEGVLQLWDAKAEPVIAPGMAVYAEDPRHPGQSAIVYVGIQGERDTCFGRPLLDAAFDGAGYAYVAPVVVEPDNEEHDSYLAAARLQLGATSTSWELIQLYDDPPVSNDNKRRNFVREIEVDAGGNVYVLNVHEDNWSSMLWQYAPDGTLLNWIHLDKPGEAVKVVDPLALHVSPDGGTIYVASGQGGRQANYCEVYGLSTLDFSLARTIGITGMELVTDITERAADGTLWISGFRKHIENIGGTLTISYIPYVTTVPAGATAVDALALTGRGDHDLVLPTSILWTGTQAVPATEE